MKSCKRLSRPVVVAVLALLGAALGNFAFSSVEIHPNHWCKPLAQCDDFYISGCPAGGWCLDTETDTQFPKCMPLTSHPDCVQDSAVGQTICAKPRCVSTGDLCSPYTSFHCIP